MNESYPLPSGRDFAASAMEWKSFVEELRRQWKLLWIGRIYDKDKAEGIARLDFELLFVDRGTVIFATRRHKPLDFKEILEQYELPYEVKVRQEKPSPHVGGWRKFGKQISAMQSKKAKRQKKKWLKNETKNGKKRSLQLKKGGRGWLHSRNQ